MPDFYKSKNIFRKILYLLPLERFGVTGVDPSNKQKLLDFVTDNQCITLLVGLYSITKGHKAGNTYPMGLLAEQILAFVLQTS